MRSFKLALIAAASVLAMSSGAFAADPGTDSSSKDGLVAGSGWYVSGSTGLAFMESSSNRSGASRFDASGDNPGFAVNGALGKEIGNGFRFEGELAYRQIGLDHITVYGGGLGSGAASGDASALSLMGNGYYDFDTGGPIRPFVGAGLGAARVALSDVTAHGAPLVDDSDVVFAYQTMAGLEYQLTQRGTLFTQYRYFAVDDPRFDTASGGRVSSELATHNFEVGYRVAF